MRRNLVHWGSWDTVKIFTFKRCFHLILCSCGLVVCLSISRTWVRIVFWYSTIWFLCFRWSLLTQTKVTLRDVCVSVMEGALSAGTQRQTYLKSLIVSNHKNKKEDIVITKTKRKISDSVLRQKPLYYQKKNQVNTRQHKDATKNFDYKTFADWLTTISLSNYC